MQYEQSHSNQLTPADYQIEPTLKTQIEWTLNELEAGESVVLIGDIEVTRQDHEFYEVKSRKYYGIVKADMATHLVFSAL